METILVVDDNQDLRFNLSSILEDEGYNAIAVGDGERALKELKRCSPCLVLLDIKLPGADGIKVLEEMKQIDKDLLIIMLTAFGEIKGAIRAMKLGAYDYITKPFDNEELVLTIKKALKTQHLTREVEHLRNKLGEKIAVEKKLGESPEIKQVLKQVELIAPTNMTVILQGESGTGKELISQMIHQKSKRKGLPFVAVDCGTIPETLVESEFFGYEKGAFTGADDRKEGKFEAAHNGTLFLDELTNLSDSMQMKLLRVVEERKLQHLGARRDIRIDIRIIVATNINLAEAVRAGKFRDDLFHRLNEFYIDLPSLRERKEDIPVLAKCFLDEANSEFNKMVKGFSPESMKFLLTYAWPGNVRELKNFIRKAVLLTDSEYILIDNLSTSVSTGQNLAEKDNLGPSASFKNKTKDFERELIQTALKKAGGNKLKAAKILQINRKALYRKMRSLGL